MKIPTTKFKKKNFRDNEHSFYTNGDERKFF